MDTSTSSPTLLGRGTARLAALVTWLTGSEPTKPTVPTGITPSTIVVGSPTPVPPKGPSKSATQASKGSESGSGSTRKTRLISLMPEDLTDEEAAQMVDYMRGKYGLPFIIDESVN